MKHTSVSILVVFLSLLTSLFPLFSRAQVRTGTLPNGLTYYVMSNREPAGQADFFLVQRTGSVHERDNERGLAHFLEHMAFNGSEHFPGNSLIEWLESIGVRFGRDLNAYTAADETVYNISRVPALRESSLDSCLLVLRDWSSALSLNDSDIEAERGVIEGEWRHRSSASNRILERILPQIYPGSIYGHRMPIGKMKVVRNFKPKTLREYYHCWHRPGNQAVVVVGDFDAADMERKVKRMFATSVSSASSKSAALPAVPDNKRMIVAIGSDPEQGNNVLQLHFRHHAPQLQGKEYWRRRVGETLLVNMMVERMDSLEHTPDCPWQTLGIGFGKYMLSRGERSLTMRGMVRPGREQDAFAQWYAAVLRALDHGFTPEEMEMAKVEYMGELTRQRRKGDADNTACARRFARHFLDGGPLTEIGAELDSLQAYMPSVTAEYCTSLLGSVADRTGSGRNMAVIAMRPEKSEPLTAAMFRKSMDRVNEMVFTPYSVSAVTGPLLEREPERGAIVGADTVTALGCRLYTLSNGVKVYAHRTDSKPGEFFMVGKGPGGFSQRYSEELVPEMKMLNDVMPLCRFGNFSQSMLRRRLAGKDMDVRTAVDNTAETVQLSAGPDDREDAFRLLYLKLTDVHPDADNFALWQAATADRMESRAANPVQVMGDSIHLNVYNRHPLGAKESADMVRSLRPDTVLSIYRDRFADFSDFTFYVSGDFEWAQLRDLLERYVASLPASGRMETPRDINYRYTPGRRDIDFSMPAQMPVAITYSFLSGPAEYDIRNYLTATIAGQILKKRLLADLREKRGWTYSVTGHCSINPELNGTDAPAFLWPVYIKTAPEHAAEVKQAVEQAYARLAAEEPTQQEIESVRGYLRKNYGEGLADNGFRLSAMQKYSEYGLDFINGYLPALDSVTPADISRFTRRAVAASRTRLTLTAK